MSLTTVANLVFFLVEHRETRHWGREKDAQTLTLVDFNTNCLMILNDSDMFLIMQYAERRNFEAVALTYVPYHEHV